jgi:hypothetical protein
MLRGDVIMYNLVHARITFYSRHTPNAVLPSRIRRVIEGERMRRRGLIDFHLAPESKMVKVRRWKNGLSERHILYIFHKFVNPRFEGYELTLPLSLRFFHVIPSPSASTLKHSLSKQAHSKFPCTVRLISFDWSTP